MRFFILFLCLCHCLLAQAKEGDDLKATSFAEKEVTDLTVHSVKLKKVLARSLALGSFQPSGWISKPDF